MEAITAMQNPALATLALPKTGLGKYLGYLLLAIGGSLVLWLSAKVHVPSYPVPMTLQTLAMLGMAAAFGWRLGLATLFLYLAEGAYGLPVFSGTPERGLGLAYMMGPTGGYMVGWIVAVGLVGWLAQQGFDRSPLKLIVVSLAGAAIILAFGFAYLSTQIGAEAAWNTGVAPFIFGDAMKSVLAGLAVPAIYQLFRTS